MIKKDLLFILLQTILQRSRISLQKLEQLEEEISQKTWSVDCENVWTRTGLRAPPDKYSISLMHHATERNTVMDGIAIQMDPLKDLSLNL